MVEEWTRILNLSPLYVADHLGIDFNAYPVNLELVKKLKEISQKALATEIS